MKQNSTIECLKNFQAFLFHFQMKKFYLNKIQKIQNEILKRLDEGLMFKKQTVNVDK